MRGALNTDIYGVSDTGGWQLQATKALKADFTSVLIKYAELHWGGVEKPPTIRFFPTVLNRIAWESIIANHS